MTPALLLCLVVGVSDGDTLTARCGDETIKVRLAEIDAPEKSQAYGQRSKQALAALCFQQPGELRPLKSLDRYGRTVARVVCNGVDENLAQVQAGMAWAYTKYLTDPTIKAAESSAKSGERGLWADPQPVPPWEWRKAQKSHVSP